MPPPALRLRGVSRRFGRGPEVLRGVDLDVEPGQVVLLRGGNGSGKTTLLRVAAGILAPDAGSAERFGPVGYQPQTGGEPPPRLAVRTWLGFTTGRRREEACRMLAELGGPAPHRPLAELSGGSLAKVLLASALTAGTGLAVLDEPFAALDAGSVPVAARLVTRAAERGAAVLLTDHGAAAADLAGVVADLAGGAVTASRAVAGDGAEASWHLLLRRPGQVARAVVVPARERDATLLAVLSSGGEVLAVREAPPREVP
ncbi:ABC-type multidrug transport system ATPase subunit [Kineococcus xinjiangensis]|uniref:ABC-type multidrug transport system ATPase subunit n=1 Tax=Kineococcus xinjiangensis TaxID=512762 RepID=A0A2S6IVP9_9ACTN|nr:ATP-binding cassette domain-containing protein [Kineococcus xinjiangensis]PPK98424.1 ABC-type multidrug transport system ATPase subunit [Kineococcus xinjiangensis]